MIKLHVNCSPVSIFSWKRLAAAASLLLLAFFGIQYLNSTDNSTQLSEEITYEDYEEYINENIHDFELDMLHPHLDESTMSKLETLFFEGSSSTN